MATRQKIAIFWPGDYRERPNEWALPGAEQATVQLERALQKLGRSSYRIEGFLSRPHEAIEKLGPIDDPMIGVYTHWVYGPPYHRWRSRKRQSAIARQQFLRTVARSRRAIEHGRLPGKRWKRELPRMDQRPRLARRSGTYGTSR